jgi:hypothetical protein
LDHQKKIEPARVGSKHLHVFNTNTGASQRTLTQPAPSIRYGDPIVDFDTEDIGGRRVRNPSPVQAEIDGIREAVRLSWLEMAYSQLSQPERWGIRVDVTLRGLCGYAALSGKLCIAKRIAAFPGMKTRAALSVSS